MSVVAPADLVFERADNLGASHEQVVFCTDETTGLRAITALHDTRLGPALGGTRFYPYGSEREALTDVLRLSQGMTHKSAAAGLALGGGTAVILGDPKTLKTPALLGAYGRYVDSLNGRYYTAADLGTTAQDLDIVASSTSVMDRMGHAQITTTLKFHHPMPDADTKNLTALDRTRSRKQPRGPGEPGPGPDQNPTS